MLLQITPVANPVYGVEELAALLVAAEADLGSIDDCLRALIERGIRPEFCRGTLLEARIEAQNILAARYWRRRTAQVLAGPLPAALAAVVVSAGIWAGLSAPVHAAEIDAEGGSLLADLLLSGLLLAAVVFVTWVLGYEAPGHDD